MVFTGQLESDLIELIYLEKDGIYSAWRIESFSARPDQAFIKLEGIDSFEAAAELKASGVFIKKSTRRKKATDDFYDDEIVGFSVVDKLLGDIGPVTRVEYSSRKGQSGSGLKFLVVRASSKELLIPAGKPFIEKISVRSKLIHTLLPEGFLDI